MAGTSSQENISTRQRKLAELARIEPKLELTTIAHHIEVVWLEEAWRRTRKDGAAGVDGVTAAQYAANLEENLTRLLERFKTGRYRAPAVRRVHLPKPGTGKTRPIGIPTLEDKVLQRAVLMALEPIFEQDFLDCAYGFRPGRGAHQALERLWGGLMAMGGGWVIDLDIQNFFDDVDRNWLRNFLGQRVRDGVICRAIGKWLNAGIMEGGQLHYPEQGTPQGGVISPLLANLYLHHVLDLWFAQAVKPRLQGSAFEVRFADDAVLVFEREEDARRVLAVLGKRLAKYGLRLHPDKTRLIDFRKPRRKGQSFQYLGFTHYWGRSRKGRWVVKRKTARDRLSRSLQAINHWCRRHRHWPIPAQQAALSRKLKGHYAYYGIVGNSQSLARFLYEVRRRWYKWLSRRNRERMNWDHFGRLYKRYPLPPPRLVHGIARRVATP
ncbi:RNA-directed DNA polymerase [Methylomarinovum tepidoasis]|uniref:RNA-directed DNA polymerase n=1 Tax=Methylomarinovum tepidoasis TaxID=2840183 RepID=A0AAU9C8N1_9GAMM|nr:group II intron reverse transcriptase/maturase [Methylomarinovum sp. IN45]BCX89644.1 RNA-directed DNA polymerase [Methylomarinovum sp. IN45]